jgi:hypothetical protein
MGKVMLKDLLNILSNYQQIEVIELINSLKRGLYSEKQITEYLLLEQKINKARKELDKYD